MYDEAFDPLHVDDNKLGSYVVAVEVSQREGICRTKLRVDRVNRNVVYYDTWVGRLQRKPHEAASTCRNKAVDRFAMHTY